MKTLLAILLSFIIAEAPVLARDTYTIPTTGQSLGGSYAGVLIPTADDLLSSTATNFGLNALGLFTLSIPSSGIGSGSVVIFTNGRTFTGAIQALQNPDPNNLGITGVLTASFSYSLYVELNGTAGQTVTTLAVTANAEGSFDAAAVSDSLSVGGFGLDLDGTSQIGIDQGFVGSDGAPEITEQVTFAIEGYEQSNVASATSTGT